MFAASPCACRFLLPGFLLIAFLISGCEPTVPPPPEGSTASQTASKRAEMRKLLQNPQSKEAAKPAAP